MNPSELPKLNLSCVTSSTYTDGGPFVKMGISERAHPIEFTPPTEGESRLELQCPFCGQDVAFKVISLAEARRHAESEAKRSKVFGIVFLVLFYAGMAAMAYYIHPAFPIIAGSLVFLIFVLPKFLKKSEAQAEAALFQDIEFWGRLFQPLTPSQNPDHNHIVGPREA